MSNNNTDEDPKEGISTTISRKDSSKKNLGNLLGIEISEPQFVDRSNSVVYVKDRPIDKKTKTKPMVTISHVTYEKNLKNAKASAEVPPLATTAAQDPLYMTEPTIPTPKKSPRKSLEEALAPLFRPLHKKQNSLTVASGKATATATDLIVSRPSQTSFDVQSLAAHHSFVEDKASTPQKSLLSIAINNNNNSLVSSPARADDIFEIQKQRQKLFQSFDEKSNEPLPFSAHDDNSNSPFFMGTPSEDSLFQQFYHNNNNLLSAQKEKLSTTTLSPLSQKQHSISEQELQELKKQIVVLEIAVVVHEAQNLIEIDRGFKGLADCYAEVSIITRADSDTSLNQQELLQRSRKSISSYKTLQLHKYQFVNQMQKKRTKVWSIEKHGNPNWQKRLLFRQKITKTSTNVNMEVLVQLFDDDSHFYPDPTPMGTCILNIPIPNHIDQQAEEIPLIHNTDNTWYDLQSANQGKVKLSISILKQSYEDYQKWKEEMRSAQLASANMSTNVSFHQLAKDIDTDNAQANEEDNTENDTEDEDSFEDSIVKGIEK